MERRAKGRDFNQALLRQIPLVALRHAAAVAEHLNFRHAANALGTTQSSVSARIKGLEDALGILLFERRCRGVRLTEAGRRFTAEVSIAIEHLDQAVMTASAVSSGATGRLAIGLPSFIVGTFFADLRMRFSSMFPDVEQIVMEELPGQAIARVREGKLDIAFVLGAVKASDCHSRLLWCEPMVVALPADHPLAGRHAITWLDLADEIFLVRCGGTGLQVFEHVVRRLSERERSPRIQRCDVARDTLMGMGLR